MTEEKFECVFNQYRDMVMHRANDILNDTYLAQDVCQDVFFKLSFGRLDRLKTEGDIKRYLSAMAYNRAIDYYRKLQRAAEVCLEDERYTMIYVDIEKKLDRSEFMSELFQALEEKSPKWYEIVRRVGFYDEDPILVARDMGVTLGSLRTTYHRAKAWIRKRFENEYEYLRELD